MASWIESAKKAAEATKDAEHGKKQLALSALAKAHGWSVRRLERDLSALSAIEAISRDDKAFSIALEALPADAVLAAARWHRFAPDDARNFTMKSTPPSVRELVRAEREARAAQRGQDAGGVAHELYARLKLETDLRWTPGQQLTQLAGSLRSEPSSLDVVNWVAPRSDYERYLGLSYVTKQLDLGIVGAPSHAVAATYTREAKRIWSRAVSCALVVPVIALVFPSTSARDLTAQAVPLPPSGHDGWPDWKPPSVQPNVLRLAGPKGGIIILTSLSTFIEDWTAN